jgi:Fe-S-cluster containining protein
MASREPSPSETTSPAATGDRGPLPSTAPAGPEDLPGALRFLHLVDAQTKARVVELASNLNALIETLVGEGHLPLEAYEKRRRLTLVRENERASHDASIAVADVPDKYALEGLPQIDCEARLPLCRARCCAMSFALSVQDLDERVVRWNYRQPYKIAQGEDGYCVHNTERRACSIYAQRPAICRTYDCRQDRRVWIDFDKRIPAP